MLAAIREEFDAGRADETETAAAIRAAWREAGDLVDPHTAVALAVADRESPTPAFRTSCCRPPIPPSSRMRCKRLAASGRNCRPGSTG